MEKEKEIPLVNGGRDSKPESPDECSSSGEKDPCLPHNNRPNILKPVYDEVDNKKKLSSSSDSLNKNGSDRPQRFSSGFEDKLRKKTGLSHVGLIVAGIILALLLICLIVIISLGASWPRTPHSQQFPVCTSAACLQASAQVLPKMNTTVSPCEDFWRYSCGQWLKSHSLPPTRSRWSLDEERAYKYREHLRTLITTLPYPTDPRSIPWKMLNLYDSCMNLDNVEADAERPLRKLIMELGGWSVLRDFSLHTWDIRNVLVRLHSEHNVSPFFRVQVVPDPQKPSKPIIQISPSGLDLPDKSYYYRPPDTGVPKAYMNYVRDVVLQLGATSSDAQAFSQDLFFFQKRIAEMTPDPEELQNPVATNRRVTITNLTVTARSIPLLEILQAMFPKAAIHGNTEVLVPSPRYLVKISEIISNSDRSALNNYVLWIFTSSYLPYLSQKFNNDRNVYWQTLTGVREPLQRWEMCIETVQKYMGFALAALSSEALSSTERESSKAKVGEIFNNIQEAVRNSLDKATWFGKELQLFALKKVNSMVLQVGFPAQMLSKTYLQEYYSNLLIHKHNLLQNIRNAVDFQIAMQRSWLMEPREEYKWIAAMSENTVSYIPTANKVVVPQWLLVPPFFHSQYPSSLLYGGIGVKLASAVVSAILPWNILYDGDGVLLSDNRPEVNQSMKAVREAQKSIIHDIEASNTASSFVANRTSLSTVIHIAAVRQAYVALIEALKGVPHVHQPGMVTFESEQLFFVTYAQNLCAQSTQQQVDLDTTASRHLNSSQLLPTTLRQLPEFSQAFSCSSSAEHYASSPCMKIL
ncbi:endothelin-converting enzyme 2 [Anabrus simplex]|uniref:endothelin-converting enzyme 2 n=1 Tax=Anabrus simplex TaxID=316456 RepID=UPI0034DD7B98